MRFYNSMSRQIEEFKANPSDGVIRMYSCGPTVYSSPHVGNARPAVIADVLYRLLRHNFGTPQVHYARNFTDVDDKIIAAAIAQNVPIERITEQAQTEYLEDMQNLQVLLPTYMPKATDHIADMIVFVAELIQKGHAYEVEGEVFFWVPSNPHPGIVQHADDALRAGERVAVDPRKRDPRDFVLWKPSKPGEPGWISPWSYGRPGWHIECSAMIRSLMGKTIDIHLGGQDLRFPHHESECAQSHCANDAPLANYWLHNGLLTIDGQKMSKSLGNVVLIRDLLKSYHGDIIRYFFLRTHYRSPIDLTYDALDQAAVSVDKLYRAMGAELVGSLEDHNRTTLEEMSIKEFIGFLEDDLNTPRALMWLDQVAQQVIDEGDYASWRKLGRATRLLGLAWMNPEAWAHGTDLSLISWVEEVIRQRNVERANKNWTASDRLRDRMIERNIEIKDEPTGTVWRIRRAVRP